MSAPVILAIEFVSRFFVHLFVWFYNVTAFSVLLVAIFHASFDGSINQLGDDVVPASNNECPCRGPDRMAERRRRPSRPRSAQPSCRRLSLTSAASLQTAASS